MRKLYSRKKPKKVIIVERRSSRSRTRKFEREFISYSWVPKEVLKLRSSSFFSCVRNFDSNDYRDFVESEFVGEFFTNNRLTSQPPLKYL